MKEIWGDNSGSREPSPSVSALSGFDPGREIISAIVSFYKRDPLRMAELADSEIDRSGALLGFIRQIAWETQRGN